MANTDTIEVRGPRSLDEMVSAIGAQTGETRKGAPVVRLSDTAVAIVGYDERDEYPYVVSIDSKSEVDVRRVDSLALFKRLQETPWALLLTSDDDDVEQLRPAL
ncbi:hypothetical protein [Rhodococcus sp. USK13]|uniref:hypothetical protein n=1 Tax=Rhodococcus sp. USK13 TaxID=2806442 RepID=UPI001BCF3328|nr:hypothetical protein [Rhodococcus sp. USK13]